GAPRRHSNHHHTRHFPHPQHPGEPRVKRQRARLWAAVAACLGAWAYSNGAHAQPEIIPNWREIELKDVVEAVEQVVGRTFVVDPRVRGNPISVYSRQALT